MINKKLPFIILLLCSFSLSAQVESPSLIFNRGQLWQSVFFGKIGPNFSNWAKRGPALDWPGFDESRLPIDIGGAPAHMVTGGFWVGAESEPDSIIAVEDWSIYAGTISAEPSSKYIITKHTKVENWDHSIPNAGDEFIETEWEYNLNYTNIDDRENQLPLRVNRTAHQWNGSRRDENYILYRYVYKNISDEILAADPSREVPDTLHNLYLLLNYGLQSNSRGWNILFPELTPGARNTWFFYDNTRRMIWGRAADYPPTVANEDYDYSANQGPVLEDGTNSGEWLAPGFVGVRLIFSSADKTGANTRVNKFGWSAASNSIDLSGPFTGISGTKEAKYDVLKDPANASSFVNSPGDTVYMKRNRMWSMMSLGPWDIAPGDSIIIVLAEIVDGADYKTAVDPSTTANTIGNLGIQNLRASADKAKFTFDNSFNTVDPPLAPQFSVEFYEEEKIAANVIVWSDQNESSSDPDDGIADLAGYNVYRSNYLPIGPWDLIGTVQKNDPSVYNPADSKYRFVDTTADVGASYYYALTAFDTGKTVWAANPSALFPETNSAKVPGLESSIFANRMNKAVTTTFPPVNNLDEVLVVPNPYILGDEFAVPGTPGSDDVIQFVNIPNPCTIRIYTVRGDHVKTIEVPEGTGAIASWNQFTDYGQFVESGIYIYQIESKAGNKVGKLAIVR